MPLRSRQFAARHWVHLWRSFPHLYTSLLNRTCDLAWEMRLGINTRGGVASRRPDAHDYGYVAYHTSFGIFDRLALGAKDVVVDLGAGKGRVICVAAQYPIAEAIGVEIDPELWTTACANDRKLRVRRAPARFECRSATEFNYDSATVVVMFHPFGVATMREVLARVEGSLVRRPRDLRIVYVNPLFDTLLTATSWLQRYERWEPGAWSRVKFPVHFYRTVEVTDSR